MQVQVWQIILLTIYGFLGTPMDYTMSYAITRPVTAGFVVGLVLGDVKTGMMIGGTLELMILGVGSFGGASIPDYFTATIIGVSVSIISKLTPAQGVAMSIPVALLMIQLDILAKLFNSTLVQRAKKKIAEGDLKAISRINLMGILSFGLTRAIPICLAISLGPNIIEQAVQIIPENIMNGLNVAVGILPVVGVAILLRYLPFGKLFPFFILGFLMVKLFGFSLLVVTALALVLVFILYYQQNETEAKFANIAGNVLNTGGEIDD